MSKTTSPAVDVQSEPFKTDLEADIRTLVEDLDRDPFTAVHEVVWESDHVDEADEYDLIIEMLVRFEVL